MSKPIDILLLLALPASGKSEARRYLASLSPAECREQFGIGQTVQLDDYPYVHLMRCITDEYVKRDLPGAFFLSPALPFRDPRDWGTLIRLVSEDYDDLVSGHKPSPDKAAPWLFDRIDAARHQVGAESIFSQLDSTLRDEIAAAVEDEAAKLLADKNAEHPDSLGGKTVVIEFARGGADGSPMPLVTPFGYRYSLAQLSNAILAKSSILYIWVTPEESRRKNAARATKSDDPGSILFHGVPLAVMYGDYGTDDIRWLLENSEKPNTVTVKRGDETHHLPLGRFDNRVDKTTFIHDDEDKWPADGVAALRAGLEEAFTQLQSGQD